MKWAPVIVGGFVLLAWFVFRHLSFVSVTIARECLSQGGLLVDVRSPEEFRSGHVPGAINIPLGKLRDDLPRRVKDKNQTVLVYCLSGGRSAIAKKQLKSMGYRRAFNLGSLSRANRIASATRSH